MSATATLPGTRAYRPISLPSQVAYWTPLTLILVAQTALTVRLYGGLTNDEGRYLFAGHSLLHELFHGGGSAYYEMSFSGAPAIYPPLAALAQSIGGFAAARMLSTFFMLVASCSMFGTARRLFGYWSAITACGLYAGLYITQAVGRNIIYDAMAIAVLSLAAYCASHADEWSSSGYLLAVVPLLVLADFTKYVAIIFNPAVIAICAYQIRDRGWKAMGERVLALSLTTGLAYLFTAYVAGSAYWAGMLYTTFGRHTGANGLLAAAFQPPRVIISETLSWFGAVIAAAFAAVLFAAVSARGQARWPLILLLTALSMTSVVVAIEGIHLHSNESMGRHSAFAAWFGCMAAGYLASALARQFDAVAWRVPIVSVAALAVLLSGYHYGLHNRVFTNLGGHATGVPPVFYALQPYVYNPNYRYLIDGDTDYRFLSWDGVNIPWWDLVDDNYIKYPIPGRGGNWHWTVRGNTCYVLQPQCMYLIGPQGYEAAIRAHAFAVVSLHRFTLATDDAIERAVESTPGYVLVTHQGGGPTWIYLPDYQHHPVTRLASTKA